jgi:hypothetical protein
VEFVCTDPKATVRGLNVLATVDAVPDVANHQGEVGHYRCSVMTGGRVRIVCETPYPAEFERGLIEGITRNANLARGRRYDVSFQEGEKGGKRTCTLLVSPL